MSSVCWFCRSFKELSYIEEAIYNPLASDKIEPSCSPWVNPVVLAKKMDGNLHFCIDYHWLNKVTIKVAYLLL